MVTQENRRLQEENNRLKTLNRCLQVQLLEIKEKTAAVLDPTPPPIPPRTPANPHK
jgi:hypothetical protein